MKSKHKALIVIGAALLIAIGGTIVYAALQNNTDGVTQEKETTPHVHDESHSHPETESENEAEAETTNEVSITDYVYAPATIEVKVGTKVTWINEDTVEHTVTTIDGAPKSFDSGLFGKGKSFSYTFEEAGQYDYLCTPHPYMKGTVVVTE